ncbi:MAG: hypothetical protein J6P07_01655, partial [Spirochaetaceae bacterium]|nr:hypothetical protein [Spirochaetaceae bacterium]
SLRIKGTTLLQFKSFSDEKYLNGYYLPAFATTKNGAEIRETLTLTPVSITTDGFTNTATPAIKLERFFPATGQ